MKPTSASKEESLRTTKGKRDEGLESSSEGGSGECLLQRGREGVASRVDPAAHSPVVGVQIVLNDLDESITEERMGQSPGLLADRFATAINLGDLTVNVFLELR
jgi:hypothetical protein